MSKRQIDQILVSIGSFLAVNGALVFLAPGQFATLQKISWMPDPFNRLLDVLAAHDRTSRPLGLAAALIGVLLLGVGVMRTEPAD